MLQAGKETEQPQGTDRDPERGGILGLFSVGEKKMVAYQSHLMAPAGSWNSTGKGHSIPLPLPKTELLSM